jgi:hypothetical protein
MRCTFIVLHHKVIASMNETTKLSDGQKCPAFALVRNRCLFVLILILMAFPFLSQLVRKASVMDTNNVSRVMLSLCKFLCIESL